MKKHPNEYTLTKWFFAHIDDVADEVDALWMSEHLAVSQENLRRYKAGRRALGWRNTGGIFKQLKERFPESADIFLGPTGQILMSVKLGKNEIQKAMKDLSDPHRTILLGGGYSRRADGRQNSRKLEDVFGELEGLPDSDTLRAIVYMLAWADCIQNHDTWNATCGFYQYMIPQFIFHRRVPHYEHFFDAIDAFAPLRVFKANDRSERRLSWRRQLPKYKKLRKQIAIERMKCWQYWQNPSEPVVEWPEPKLTAN